MSDIKDIDFSIDDSAFSISLPAFGTVLRTGKIALPITPANAEAYLLHRCAQISTNILEIGTQWGLFTTILAASVPQGGKVIGMDLLPLNVQTANENLRRNGLDNRALVLHTAGSTVDGAALAKVDLHAESPGLLGPDGTSLHKLGTMDVTQASIGRLRQFFGPFDMIKTDVEGFEAALIKESIDELLRPRILEIEVHPTFIHALFKTDISFIQEKFPASDYCGFYVVFRDGVFTVKEMTDPDVQRAITANLFLFKKELKPLHDELKSLLIAGMA